MKKELKNLQAYRDLQVGDYVACPMENMLINLHTEKQLEDFMSDDPNISDNSEVFTDDEEWYFFKLVKVNLKSVELTFLGTYNTASGDLSKPPLTETKVYEKKYIPYVERIDSPMMLELGIVSQSLDFIKE